MKMVRATDVDDREASVRSRISQFQGIRPQRDGGRQTQSMADIDIDNNGSISPGPENKLTRSHASAPLEDEIQSALESNENILSPLPNEEPPSLPNSKGKSCFDYLCIFFICAFSNIALNVSCKIYQHSTF